MVRHRLDAYFFPSGVRPEHQQAARAHRTARQAPVAGYVGVLERLDLSLTELDPAGPGRRCHPMTNQTNHQQPKEST